jgi:hypothetical protein
MTTTTMSLSLFLILVIASINSLHGFSLTTSAHRPLVSRSQRPKDSSISTRYMSIVDDVIQETPEGKEVVFQIRPFPDIHRGSHNGAYY